MFCRACCRCCRQRYPLLRLEVRETQTKMLLDELVSGELDAVMLALPAEGADVETLPLFTDAFLLAVPAADPLPALSRVDVADVDQRRLILLEEGHCLRDQALAFCATKRRDQPAEPRRDVADDGDADGGERLWRDAGAGSRRSMPKCATPRVKLLRFAEPEPGRSIGLAWRRTSPRRRGFRGAGRGGARGRRCRRRFGPQNQR